MKKKNNSDGWSKLIKIFQKKEDVLLAHVSMYAHPAVITTKPTIIPFAVAPKSI
jgi:hypothetical protein